AHLYRLARLRCGSSLIAEMWHDLFRHQFLGLENEVVGNLTHVTAGDQHTRVQYIGVVAELFDYCSGTANDDDAGVEQFLETAPLAGPYAAFEYSTDAPLTHEARRGKKFGAYFQASLEEPHDI